MQLRAWFAEDCSPVGELLVRHICYIARQSAIILQDSSAQDIDRLTWRVLHVRLNAVSRSVGEVARKLLEVSEREPPMRRDHCGRSAGTNDGRLGHTAYKIHDSVSTAYYGSCPEDGEWRGEIEGPRRNAPRYRHLIHQAYIA